MKKSLNAKNIIYFVWSVLYLLSLLGLAIASFFVAKGPGGFALGALLLVLFIADGFKKAAGFTKIFWKDIPEPSNLLAVLRGGAFIAFAVFWAAALYFDHYFYLKDNFFFFWISLPIAFTIIVPCFFKNNGLGIWGERNRITKIRTVAFFLLFVLAITASLVTVYSVSGWTSGYFAYVFVPMIVATIAYFLPHFTAKRWPSTNYLSLFFDVAMIVLASMAFTLALAA
jgi:hypothetical protein